MEKWCSKGQHRVRSEATRQQRAAVAGFEGGDMEELAVIAQVMSKPSRKLYAPYCTMQCLNQS